MSLCINPACPQPYYPDNHKDRFCKSCGSQMELLSRYRVIRLLSDKTGFGKVYEIHEQNIPKILKVLHEDLSNNAKAVELFQQEASVLKQMQHPGISKIDSYFQYQTRNGLVLHCIAMEKVDGFDSEQWLQKQHNHFTAQKSEQQQSRINAVGISQIKQISQTKLHTSLPPVAKQFPDKTSYIFTTSSKAVKRSASNSLVCSNAGIIRVIECDRFSNGIS